jgi:hypothetical protein
MIRSIFPTFHNYGTDGGPIRSHVCLHLHQTMLKATADRAPLAVAHTPAHGSIKEKGDAYAETPAEGNTQGRMSGVGRLVPGGAGPRGDDPHDRQRPQG